MVRLTFGGFRFFSKYEGSYGHTHTHAMLYHKDAIQFPSVQGHGLRTETED